MKETLFHKEDFVRAILDAFPAPILIVDEDLSVHDINEAAKTLTGEASKVFFRKLSGDLLHCIHARNSEGGCGTTAFCPDCVLRETVAHVKAGKSIFRCPACAKENYPEMFDKAD